MALIYDHIKVLKHGTNQNYVGILRNVVVEPKVPVVDNVQAIDPTLVTSKNVQTRNSEVTKDYLFLDGTKVYVDISTSPEEIPLVVEKMVLYIVVKIL